MSDSSMSELNLHKPSMSASASLLQRPISAAALRDRTAQLATPLPQTGQSDLCSVLVFRLGREWFAISASLCCQVMSPLAAHTLPHCSNGTLLGVVNVRGQMLLKVSLLEVLGLSSTLSNAAATETEESPRTQVYPRMVVIEKTVSAGGSDVWVFEVDELDGIHSIALDDLAAPAAGVQLSAATCTRRVFLWQNRRVSLLDDAGLFNAVRLRAL